MVIDSVDIEDIEGSELADMLEETQIYETIEFLLCNKQRINIVFNSILKHYGKIENHENIEKIKLFVKNLD